MTRHFRLAALASAAVIASLATVSIAAQKKGAMAAKPTNWGSAIERSDEGHVIGNPEAETRLVEYMSYTCSHCAEFSRTGDVAIKTFVVPRGKVSFEIRHQLRDPIDLTAALLTNCGDASQFLANHQAMISKQGEWLEKARAISQAQRTRWNFGTMPARWRAIASDLGFYDIMEARGYNRAQLDRCLADQAKATSLAEASTRDAQALNIPGTPSFAIDGKLLDGVHSWDALKPVLERLD